MATGEGGNLKGIFVCSVGFIAQGGGCLLKQGCLLPRLRYYVPKDVGCMGPQMFFQYFMVAMAAKK